VLKAKKMQKTIKYTIFKTRWGYFGLAATNNGLLRTCLPLSNPEKVKRWILTSFVGRVPSIEFRASRVHRSFGEGGSIEFDNDLFRQVQERITAYLEGARVDFRDVPVVLYGFGLFTKRVLTACRDIGFGRIVTYSRLAEMAGKPGAARAVGGVMAKNPLPLIIPCHRVICADGSMGGFSAMGGVNLKKKMLKLEGQL
jgi:methylated-DNA-[protein]-cysteine S-methyltransferase